MKVRMALLIERLTENFWIIPGSIVALLMLALFFLMQFHFSSSNSFIQELIAPHGDTEALRLLLSSIATSLMTVVGVLFSIIIVVIQQMSNQYTPRVVSNFTRSKMAQVVLGLYVGTFIYCLILLMNIEENSRTPNLAVAFASFLAILCLLILIFYIHHITHSIQSTDIIAEIARESITSLRNVIKDRQEASTADGIINQNFKECLILQAEEVGYIEAINWRSLQHKIKQDEWELILNKAPGDFLQKDMELLTLWSHQPVNKKCLKQLFKIGPQRTISQDPSFGVQKLTDIALKALSPGINDPSTAIEAIHSLTSILLEYLKNLPLQEELYLERCKKISFLECNFHELLEKSFGAILVFSKEHKAVNDLIHHNLIYLQQFTQDKELIDFLNRL